MSDNIDWRAIADELGTIHFTNGGYNERGGDAVAVDALNLIVGNDIGADAVDFYLSQRPGRELARSVLRILRPASGTKRCLEVFRSAPNSEDACAAAELLRSISKRPILEHFDELMSSPNPVTRAWVVAMLDDLWMAGELEVEDGRPYLAKALNDPAPVVVERAKDIKEMWDEEEKMLSEDDSQ